MQRLPIVYWLCLVCSVNAMSQNSVLTGKIKDAVEGVGIEGVDVTVQEPPGAALKTISNASGHYTIRGLTKGKRVSIAFSLGGYVPHPRSEEVLVSQALVTKDVELMRDTDESAYWRDWSQKVRGIVEALNVGTHSGQAYEKIWAVLGNLGVSAEAQVEAARQLVKLVPDAANSKKLYNFASVKADDLTRVQDNVNKAAEGQTKLSRQNSVSGDVAATVAADSVKKTGSHVPSSFSRDFSATWGSEAGHEFETKVQQKGPSPTDLHNLSTMATTPK